MELWRLSGGIAQTKYAGVWGCCSYCTVTNWRFYENIYAERLLSMPVKTQKDIKCFSGKLFRNHKSGLFLFTAPQTTMYTCTTARLSKQLTNAMKTDFEQHFYADKTHNLSDGTPNILRMNLYTRINDFLKRELKRK